MNSPEEYIKEHIKGYTDEIPGDVFYDICTTLAHANDMTLEEATKLFYKNIGALRVGEVLNHGVGKSKLWPGQDAAVNFSLAKPGFTAAPMSSQRPLGRIELSSSTSLQKVAIKVGDEVRVKKNEQAPWGAEYQGIIEKINADNTLDIRDIYTGTLNTSQPARLLAVPMAVGREDLRIQQRRVGDPKGMGESAGDVGGHEVKQDYPNANWMPTGHPGQEVKNPQSMFYKQAGEYLCGNPDCGHPLEAHRGGGKEPTTCAGGNKCPCPKFEFDQRKKKVISPIPEIAAWESQFGVTCLEDLTHGKIVSFANPWQSVALEQLSYTLFLASKDDSPNLEAIKDYAKKFKIELYGNTGEIVSFDPLWYYCAGAQPGEKVKIWQHGTTGNGRPMLPANCEKVLAKEGDKLLTFLLNTIASNYDISSAKEVQSYLDGKISSPSRSLKEILSKYNIVAAGDPMLNVEKALGEVKDKTEVQINSETAWTWGSRAAACYKLSNETNDSKEKEKWVRLGDAYRHESLEHAALVEDEGKLVGEVSRALAPFRKPAGTPEK